MEDKNLVKVELKFLIFGYDKVGKKSIVKRLQLLKSTETKNIKVEAEIPKTPILKAMLRAPGNKFHSLKELKEAEANNVKIKKLTAFKKIFTLGEYYIEVSSMIMKKPEPIHFSDPQNVVEELEENEKAHKLKFDVVKQEVKEVLSTAGASSFDNTYYIFTYVYDLANLDSFEKAKFYHSEISRTFGINSRNDCATLFIGNKVDIKTILNDTNKNIFYDFYSNSEAPYFEVSTSMYFNFERLFKNIFTTLIQPKRDGFKQHYFIEKLDNVLFERNT